MARIEKQLKRLPRKKLGLLATVRIFFRLTKKLWDTREKADLKKNFVYLRPVAIGVTLSFLLLVIIPGYAYASKQVTYGDWLYGVKKGLEKIEFSFADSPEEEVEKKEKFIARRLEEAEVLSGEQDENANGPLIETINEVTKLQKEVKDLPAQAGEKKDAKEIRDREKKVAVLSEIARMVGIEASEEVVDSVAEALEAFKTPPGQGKREDFDRPERGFTRFPEASNTPEAIEDVDEDSDKEEEAGSEDSPKRTQPEEVRQSYEELRQAVNTLRDDLREGEYEEEDIEELSAKLESKLEKAEKAIEKENLGAAAGLMKATEALTNNAKYFFESKNNPSTSFGTGKSKTNKKNKNKDDKGEEKADDEDGSDPEEEDDEENDDDDKHNKKNWLKYWK